MTKKREYPWTARTKTLEVQRYRAYINAKLDQQDADHESLFDETKADYDWVADQERELHPSHLQHVRVEGSKLLKAMERAAAIVKRERVQHLVRQLKAEPRRPIQTRRKIAHELVDITKADPELMLLAWEERDCKEAWDNSPLPRIDDPLDPFAGHDIEVDDVLLSETLPAVSAVRARIGAIQKELHFRNPAAQGLPSNLDLAIERVERKQIEAGREVAPDEPHKGWAPAFSAKIRRTLSKGDKLPEGPKARLAKRRRSKRRAPKGSASSAR